MICVGYIAYMVGFSMAYPNTMTAGMSVIPARMQPDGNAMFSTFQQLAGAVGTTVMSICLRVAQAGRSITADKAAFAAAMWPSLCCWLCSSARSWRISAHSPRAERRDN